MTKKCIYCKKEIPGNSVVDICSSCGVGVWGEKMFKAIIQSMEDARQKGDLCHTEPLAEKIVEKEPISSYTPSNE